MSKKHRKRRDESAPETEIPADVPAIPSQIPKDDMLPAEIDDLPLTEETAKVVNDMVRAKSVDELKSYTDMFRLNMAKKNAVRIAKLQNLLDAVNEQAIDRFISHPDEFSNKEVLDYMKVVQDQIQSSQQNIDSLGDEPAIQINNQRNEVNINVDSGGLSMESKARVLDAVKSLLAHASSQQPYAEPDDGGDESAEGDDLNG